MTEPTDREKIKAEIDRLWDDEGKAGTTVGEFKDALAVKIEALAVWLRFHVDNECGCDSCEKEAKAALAGVGLC